MSQPSKPQPSKPQQLKRPTKVRLAQGIQVRLADGTLRTLAAGEEHPVGTKPGQVHPSWLEHQPLLDLDGERNQKGVAERHKVLGTLTDRRQEAEAKGRQAAARIGRREFKDYGLF